MKFRTYTAEDKAVLLEVFRSNCPKYFVETDEADFIDFLDNYADENYLVAIKDEQVIGCGGHYTKGTGHGIAWVMFKSGSIGRRDLLNVTDRFYGEVESRIRAEGELYNITVYTTQLMVKLFERYGFDVGEVTKNGFGDGLDEVEMIKQLTV